MRHACRDSVLIALLVVPAVSAFFGCGGANSSTLGPAVSTPTPTPTPAPGASAASERWDAIDDARNWPSASDAFVSRGHGVGHYRIDVHVAPPFLDPYRSLVAGQTAPVGATVAAFHQDADTATQTSVYVMRKRTEDEWEFFVTEPDGRIATRSDLSLCATCHSDAPADHLFGVPAPAQPKPAAAIAPK